MQGYHFNSKHWQNYKKSLPPLPQKFINIAVGMLLGDATMYHVSCDAWIKFEQGWKQKEFCFHLFYVFSTYCFMQKPETRYQKDNKTPKSYWFKTFSFPDFIKLYRLFYKNTKTKRKKKYIKKILITNFFNVRRVSLLDYV